jgi:hypothetical protein
LEQRFAERAYFGGFRADELWRRSNKARTKFETPEKLSTFLTSFGPTKVRRPQPSSSPAYPPSAGGTFAAGDEAMKLGGHAANYFADIRCTLQRDLTRAKLCFAAFSFSTFSAEDQ